MISIDQDSNQARLDRHRSLHNIGLKPLPSALETTLLARQHGFTSMAQAIGSYKCPAGWTDFIVERSSKSE